MPKDKNYNYKKVNLTSSDLTAEQFSRLRELVPETFTEGKVDWEKLKTVLGEHLDSRPEKFNFTWAGKSNAIKNVLLPSKATLKPAEDESIKFNESENLFIEGENLEVLKLLQKSYFEKVKVIYIDPPYNTGGDFIYPDDFSAPLKQYLEMTGQVDGDGNKLQTNKEASGRYHSDWLSMMYPRLKLAWNLLRNDGVIFVSIDDHEVQRLRMVMDELFGEENFIGQLIIQSNPRGSQEPFGVSAVHEYVLVYAKKEDGLYSIVGYERSEEDAEFSFVDKNGRRARLLGLRKRGGDWRRSDRPNMYYPFWVNPKTKKVALEKNEEYSAIVYPVRPGGEESRWTWGKETAASRIEELVAKEVGRDGKKVFDIYRIDYLEGAEGEIKREKLKSILQDKEFNYQHARQYFKEMFGNSELFDFPKPPELIKKLVAALDEKDFVALDFFAGSATTAQAILELNEEDGGNRRFVLVQLPEPTTEGSEAYKLGFHNIAEISKERIRKVIRGYGDNPKPITSGFKVFKLAQSNYPENNFEFDPEKSESDNQKSFQEYLNRSKQTLFTKFSEVGVVYENIIKEGLSLNSKIQSDKIGKDKIYRVIDGDRELLICLDGKIQKETVKELTGKAYKGKTFICLDNSLDDAAKANLGLNLELKTI